MSSIKLGNSEDSTGVVNIYEAHVPTARMLFTGPRLNYHVWTVNASQNRICLVAFCSVSIGEQYQSGRSLLLILYAASLQYALINPFRDIGTYRW